MAQPDSPVPPPPDAPSEPALVFVHVPKTAGSTLRWIIQRQYPADRTVTVSDDLVAQYRALRAMPVAQRQQLRCVIGHVPFGVDRLLPQGARYITMLRDPVEWTLSFHAHVKRMPAGDGRAHFVPFRDVHDADLGGFIEFLRDSRMADMQTRVIAGELNEEAVLPPYKPLSAQALEYAKRHLREQFDCVGLVERFDESLVLMQRRFGWRKVHYRSLNVGRQPAARAELPSSLRDRILDVNARDVDLYEDASRMLAAAIAAEGLAFQMELRRLQRQNAVYTALVPLYERSGLHRVRQALRERGWSI